VNNRFPVGQATEPHAITKEELEREERRKQLQREIAQSVTTDTPISPFIQRIDLSELKPNTTYEHNYISLRVESLNLKELHGDQRCMICRCSGLGAACPLSAISDSETQIKQESPSDLYLNVQLFNHYANDTIIKVDKIINIGKFKTGPTQSNFGQNISERDDTIDNSRYIGFDVIVNYENLQSPQSNNKTAPRPLIPFVSVTDMIEEPLEPYVETAPSPEVRLDGGDEKSKPDFEVNVRAGAGAVASTKAPKTEIDGTILDHDCKKIRLGSEGVASTASGRSTPHQTLTKTQ